MASGSPLYSFAAKCIQNGEREFKFDSLKGRVVLVVNVASK
jgi:glutathione peroxidase-family protein